ncbi:hypothetical protein CBR_g28672 [Chara braunii]|uniref:Uncharacterized protein n=1 Tax=Chara braunii TaxID=69332 RepID=A0A388L9J5_CHABU|nr:hypothetical protein CBR_g28672 [Chara braunii]|eukprot:GBG78958.1 hypothetical protein CBR_g28672 [Chara braunii]
MASYTTSSLRLPSSPAACSSSVCSSNASTMFTIRTAPRTPLIPTTAAVSTVAGHGAGASEFMGRRSTGSPQVRIHTDSSRVPLTTKSQPLQPVRAAKGKQRFRRPPGYQQPRVPQLPNLEEDGNSKFILFIRSKNVPQWYPLSVVTGGSQANILTTMMESKFGRKLYQSTLTRNVAAVIYRDEKEVQTTAIKQWPVLKNATAFEYGYKVADKNNPRASFMASNVIKIPPESELKTVAGRVKDFWTNLTSGGSSSEGNSDKPKKSGGKK